MFVDLILETRAKVKKIKQVFYLEKVDRWKPLVNLLKHFNPLFFVAFVEEQNHRHPCQFKSLLLLETNC